VPQLLQQKARRKAGLFVVQCRSWPWPPPPAGPPPPRGAVLICGVPPPACGICASGLFFLFPKFLRANLETKVCVNAQTRGPVDLLRQAQFAPLDLMRRAQGQALGAIGFDPAELTHRRLASGDHWRLRDYGGPGPETSLLIIAAPIKRPYIWDLGPNVSAIRYCQGHGVRVYLVEWIAPKPSGGHVGLDECVRAISECVARIATEPKATKPFLIGHSLGETLAAAFSACEPRAVRGLLLLGAPLCFQSKQLKIFDH
jgi:hypothetical protein